MDALVAEIRWNGRFADILALYGDPVRLPFQTPGVRGKIKDAIFRKKAQAGSDQGRPVDVDVEIHTNIGMSTWT